MTNTDKYLKDGISGNDIFNLSQALGEYLTIKCRAENVFVSDINTFFVLKLETTPTLTEDERVILRNIDKEYEYIRRNCNNVLQVTDHKMPTTRNIWYKDLPYNSLFQFIKERRRI